MTKDEFEKLRPGDVIQNLKNQVYLTVLRDGNPRDPSVQIQLHELKGRYSHFKIITKVKDHAVL